jgi:hypothetical protein
MDLPKIPFAKVLISRELQFERTQEMMVKRRRRRRRRNG